MRLPPLPSDYVFRMSWQKLAAVLDSTRHRIRLSRWDREQAWGRRAEDLAHRYLRAQGFQVVARNYRRRGGRGELDLVAWDGPALVFVEVKARGNGLVAPELAVDREKREHLLLTAAEYLRRARVAWEAARFDIVSVIFEGQPSIRHLRDA
ncbi:MAG TPA: YraN family protein, partial [Bryobacteraceae bacterium]|nr:YraN family protein [Bryobacteraceae bacterium]